MFHLLVLKSFYHSVSFSPFKSMQNFQLRLKIHQSSLQPVMGTKMRSFLMLYVLHTVLTYTQYILLYCTTHHNRETPQCFLSSHIWVKVMQC